MLTIGDKTYTEEDLDEAQILQLKRITALNNDLTELNMRTQELNVLISAYTNSIKESLTEEDKTLQKQLTLIKEKVEESLKHKDFKKALSLLASIVSPVSQFLDNVQVNCEDKELRNLRYSLLNKISETADSVLVFSELDNK